ncbi:hypothetical protein YASMINEVIRUS_204 [Yasminevirus sp. GU-2018]|uniref:Uncharacterized protein n=1 Tax=Yasminevirus sp. GU-2018 TaxID=2420051 RepID=A0A5K0U8A0_9VIRU|nr:hypothetical protein YASMINEVIRUS_204 [Yasminevirus sp. GU-2018]
MSSTSNANIYDKVRSHPLYQEAFKAFKEGDQKKGMELMYKLQKEQELMSEISEHTSKMDPSAVGVVMIKKDQPIPEGYNRNTFTEQTCITTQQKDLPEWKTIIARILYDDKEVYEDHYALEFTEKNAMYTIKRDNPGSFACIVVSSSNAKATLAKLRKNALHRIIDSLSVTLSNVTYSSGDILESFVNSTYHEHLRDIKVIHADRDYTPDEIKILRQMFRSTKWQRFVFECSNTRFDLSKCS